MDSQFDVVNLNIDRIRPKVEIINIENTNSNYNNYANKTHTVTVTVKVTDRNLDKVFMDKEHIKIKINNNYSDKFNMTCENIKDLKEEKVYKIKLNNILENGKLKVELTEGIAIDTSELESEKQEVDTNIMIDNIAPLGTFKEEKISDGKSKAIININEGIRKLDGWNMSNNNMKIEKEFTNNISYILPITDYAGNKSYVDINITTATYINIIYASHNSEVGWTFGYGNYDIAGKKAVEKNRTYKTEAIAFNFSGNVPTDFIQANAYVYTHWGENTYGESANGVIYKYGYNPGKNSYKSMNSNDLVTIDGKKYFQFGGNAINLANNTDTNGNNPIPVELANTLPYGICGINMVLKDYSYYSIVYQILVGETGWIKACSDGEECIYSKTKPMSAFRIALVPKSEKQYLLDTWNKDIGTYNLNK